MADHKIEAAGFRSRTLRCRLVSSAAIIRRQNPGGDQCAGMDSYKEDFDALYGDRFLNRGFATLNIDGPASTSRRCSHLFLDGQLGSDRKSSLRLARQAPEVDMSKVDAVRHELRHVSSATLATAMSAQSRLPQ